MTADWRLRSFESGDETAIVTLFRRVFGTELSEETWRWKLRPAASPVANVWLGVDRDDRVLFHYGGIPYRLHLDGKERQAMLSVDTMTDPTRRRRGLLSVAGARIYETWSSAGVDLVLGLPNEQWGSRAEALGWRPLFPLRWRIAALRPERVLARKLRMPALARLPLAGRAWRALSGTSRRRATTRTSPTIAVTPLEQASADLDRLWRRLEGETRFGVVRDRRWVDWRYLQDPEDRYEVLLATEGQEPRGYAAYSVRDLDAGRFGFLAELITSRDDLHTRRALIGEILTRFEQEGVDAAACLATPGSSLDRTLRRWGFVFGRRAFLVQVVPMATDLPPLADLADPANWSIMGGDFDVI